MNSENPAQPISVVLMDDHRIVREGLAAFCDARPELHIAGQCSDGLAAVEMIKALTPDFAIIDLQLPNLHGLEVIRKVRETNAVCKLVVFTISRDEKMVLEALRAGANGYLVKDGPARHLLDAIRCIRDGGVYISPILRGYLLQDSQAPARPRLPRRPRRPPKTGCAGASLQFEEKLADAVATRNAGAGGQP